MSEISCQIILDLLPLVKDGVASEESKKLVRDHIEDCTSCRSLYDSLEGSEDIDLADMDEKRVISRIKKRVLAISIIIIMISALVGLVLSDTMGIFYNILIMPGLGILGYFILERKSYLLVLSIFIFSYIWTFISYMREALEGGQYLGLLLLAPLNLALMYGFLTGLGVLIGFLLRYAFGKEKSYEN